MLHEHTVLTTDQLARLGFASLRTAQQRLQLLHRLDVLDRFQPYRPTGSAPLHHLLGPVGARILAAEEGLDPAALGYRRHRTLAVAHRLSLSHDIGAASSIIDLATHPHLHLTRWWSAARCARLYGHHARPDAYLTLTTHYAAAIRYPARTPTSDPPLLGWWEMFFEYDTGTENLTTLAAKLAGYHHLAAATGIRTPVGFWITRPRREPHARQALAGAQNALPYPQPLIVLTGTPQPDLHAPEAAQRREPPGIDQTTAGAVWLPLFPQPHLRHPGTGRAALVELATLATTATATATAGGGGARAALPEPDPARDPWELDTGGRVELPAPDPYPPHDPAQPPPTAPPARRPFTQPAGGQSRPGPPRSRTEPDHHEADHPGRQSHTRP